MTSIELRSGRALPFTDIVIVPTKDGRRNIESLTEVYFNNQILNKCMSAAAECVFNNPSIIADKKVLLKPNWVMHDRKATDKICLRTHDQFLLTALELVLKNKPETVVIGDAPVQSCHWDGLLSVGLSASIRELSIKYAVPVQTKDFRRVTFDPHLNNPEKNKVPLSEYTIFDLGTDSYLEPVSSTQNNFRVTSYNPESLGKSHSKGVHKYCISKELFAADVVISLPKVKTHQKTGLTCALKNLVGINGDKDFLPHHRYGGTAEGGDCYPGNGVLRHTAESLLDSANRRQGKTSYRVFSFLAAVAWKLSRPTLLHHLDAGWYGNDTTWRMVMDLNRIAEYGRIDGGLSHTPQRQLFSLCDGVIGGQGNGPLHPEPLPLGVISFTNCSGLNDVCMGTLMGFDIEKIPLLSAAFEKLRGQDFQVKVNGDKITLENLKQHAIPTLPPPGWISHLTADSN